jgi:tetratricopeptide (TPR) repeat protein
VYRIFLSSPGDVHPERGIVQAVVDRLNAERPGDPLFSLTRWEQSYYTAASTFQDQISSPGEHDIVVFIFWKRLGTDLPAGYNRPDGTSRTGTEFEFEDALEARARRVDQLPDVLVYRKTAKVLFSEESLEAERAQKKSLDQFWEHWFRSDMGHSIAGFQSFVDGRDFEQQFERNLREWLRRRHSGQVVWNVARQGSPYRGLAPFEESQSELFFGRDGDMNRARARFIEAAIGRESGKRGTPFLLILGASGSGKSSFLRAGLIPRMRNAGAPAFLEDGSDEIHAFRSLIVTPREMGGNLCGGLAAALYRAHSSITHADNGLPELAQGDYPSAESFAALAASSPASAVAPILRALDRISRDASPADGEVSPRRRGLLLAIDQMEELFARADTDREAFVNLLGALVLCGRVWIAGTMRNDFYDRLRQDANLAALADRGRLYDLMPPRLPDYRDIIRRPAQAAGLKFEISEHRDLATEIESEASSDGALPVIAFLLEKLFTERRGDVLTLETYDRLGGAAGALAQQGDEMFAALAAGVQAAFPRVVRRLVRKGLKDLAPTATSASLEAFPSGSHERQLVEALRETRLVHFFRILGTGDSAGTSVRWSHEALLTRWPRLRNCVDADRRDYETLDRMQSAFALWGGTPESQRGGRLLSGLALAEAKDLVSRWDTDVDPALREFVRESAAHAQAHRRRRRQIVTATVAALSALSIIASIAGVVAFRQRDRALVEQLAADRTTEFMIKLFKIADPGENRGSSITVREMLDRGARDVGKGLENQPAIRAELLTAMGQAYAGLGLYGPATSLLTDAVNDQDGTQVPAESRVRTLTAAGTALYLAGEYEPAANLLQQAVSIARKSLGPQNTLRSNALCGLAEVQVHLENYKDAESLAMEALVADRQRGPEYDATLAQTLDTLGTLYFFSGNLGAAEPVIREALAIHTRIAGLRDVSTEQTMDALGAILYQSGRYAESERVYNDMMPVVRDLFGADHPETATTLSNLGGSALMVGHVEQADTLLRQALVIDEKVRGRTHDDLVSPLNRLGMIDTYQGHLLEARAEINRAETIARMPDQGLLLGQVLLSSADLFLRQGDADSAAAPLRESLDLLHKAYPMVDHPEEAWRYAIWESVNAQMSALHGDVAGARSAISKAQPVIESRFGKAGFHTLMAQQRARLIEQAARSVKAATAAATSPTS